MREVTVGQIGRGLSLYAPVLVLVSVVALAAVALPGARPPAPSESALLPGVSHSTPPGETEAAQGAGEQGAGEQWAADSLADARGEATAGRAVASSVLDTPKPVLGSATAAESLSAPDCDPATGRIKVPSFYAPNCVPLWPRGSDNGGDTWPGVTRDEITVAVYLPRQDAQAAAIFTSAGYKPVSEQEEDANREKVLEAFQAHYETYGRRVKLVKVRASGAVSDEAAGKADAIRIASEVKAFAALGDPSRNPGGTSSYVEELAARGVLCVFCTFYQPMDRAHRLAPFVWTLSPSYEQSVEHFAEYVAKRLWGRPARWAGDPALAAGNRRFGLMTYDSPDGAYESGPEIVRTIFARYGIRVEVAVSYTFDMAQAQEQARTLVAKFKDAGVTSVIIHGDPLYPIFVTNEATRQRYYPEWVLAGSAFTDTAFFARTFDQTQWRNAFGGGDMPARVDPSVDELEGNVTTWHCGCRLSTYPNAFDLEILFDGIHLAGPLLTPHTFRDGLFSYKPTSGMLTRIGFSFGRGLWGFDDYFGIDDNTELWWDPQARGPDELGNYGLGMYRYVDGGRRYLPGQRPTTEPKVFDPQGTVTMYTERPPQERLPSYEHRHYRSTEPEPEPAGE